MISKARDTSKYCEFHQDYGHDTNACREVKSQIEEALKSRKLAHLVKGIRKGKAKLTDTQLGERLTPAIKMKPVAVRKEEPILMVGNCYCRIGSDTLNNALSVLCQSEVGPRVIMFEYQDIRRCEQVKRLKESLSEVPLEVSNVNNAYIFAWEYSDMTGIPRTLKIGSEVFVTEHKLNENKKITPVQQKKRGMAFERSAATSKEVEELKKAGILRETRYQT
ncbi:hypothetical protein Tco_0494953 [Tanacetum coccineum]